jgi:PAS domain S-box-containing protein
MKDPMLPRDALERLLIDESPDALIVLSPRGEVWLWNQVAERTFGYAESEARGRPLAELVVPDDQLDQEIDIRRRALDGDVLTRAALRRHRDGRLLYVDVSTRAVRDGDGEGRGGRAGDGALRCYVTIMKDVTGSKLQRDAQRIGERYAGLLDSVPDAVVIVDETGRIVLFNGQAEKVFGHSRAEVIGASIETLLPPRYREAHLGHRLRYYRTPQVRSMGAGLELYGLKRGGQEFPVEISLSPLATEDGRFVMSAIRDITDRKRVEVELQEKNAALQVANQAKDRFLATMSHELRTPLNAIIGFTGLLLMRLPGELTAEQERQLSIVKQSGEHLLSLINDLLDLARVQAGMMQLAPEPVDAAALLREVHASLVPLAQAKSLAFDVSVPGSASIRTDRRALRQILINLANNAIKFTDAGSVRLAFETAGGSASFTVADTGVGISAADQKRLFAAFTQVGDPRRRPDGTGMGLHLSARLAEMLGGRITVDSEPGRGSRFVLAIPVG